MDDLHDRIKDKNKEISKLKQAIANLNHQLLEKDKEISDVNIAFKSKKIR